MTRALIYADEGCSSVGIESLIIGVQQHLGLYAETINAEQILRGGLTNAELFIIPGGRDLPYCAKLNGRGNQLIRNFVAHGGYYVGICAGAYYACSALDFRGDGYRIQGMRELAFFDGTAVGSLPQLTQGKYYDESLKSKAMTSLSLVGGKKIPAYYHGGCSFLPNNTASFEPVAYYADNSLAVLTGTFGQGNYLLSGIHFEFQAQTYQTQIVNICLDEQQKQQEQQICHYFDQKYGVPIWQAIQKGLK